MPKRKKSSFTIIASIIFLCVNILVFFWQTNKNEGWSKSNKTTLIDFGQTSSISPKIASYILSKEASPSCKTCLACAKKFINEKEQAKIKENVKNMVFIPAGEYAIGSRETDGESNEHPLHTVRLSDYYIDKYEVSVGQYMKFVKETVAHHPEWLKPGSRFNIKTGRENYYKQIAHILEKKNYPVVGVHWKDADAYCKWAKKRLPTEAEWETAARANTKTHYHFGNNKNTANAYSWTESNSANEPHPVGQKKSNSLGLHDMHGNVWEWIKDFYDKNFYKISPINDPVNRRKSTEHPIRGGSWASNIESCRSANRASYSKANDDIGFRCAISKKTILNRLD